MVSQSRSPVPPAPLDPAGVAASLAPFGQSRMLPRAAYVDPAVFEWEQRHFFGGGWLCVGRDDQLPEPGSQRAEAVGEGSVLLTRGEDGGLHAFANTCRHRGHELLPCGASAQSKVIICPYHSWTYGLAGDLRAAAGFKHRLVVAGQHDYETTANWKILTENYHECYHCPAIHPELCKVSPPRSGKNYSAPGTWAGGWMELRDGMATMSLDGASHGQPLRSLDEEGLRTVIYVNVFPNLLLSLHPDYVMTHRLIPLAAGRTHIECTWAFAPESLAQPGFDPGYAIDFWDLTNRQDWHACESVQRGLASPHALPGPLAPEEDAVYQFVTMVARGYQGQPVWNLGLPEWTPADSQQARAAR